MIQCDFQGKAFRPFGLNSQGHAIEAIFGANEAESLVKRAKAAARIEAHESARRSMAANGVE